MCVLCIRRYVGSHNGQAIGCPAHTTMLIYRYVCFVHKKICEITQRAGYGVLKSLNPGYCESHNATYIQICVFVLKKPEKMCENTQRLELVSQVNNMGFCCVFVHSKMCDFKQCVLKHNLITQHRYSFNKAQHIDTTKLSMITQQS